MNTCTAFSTQWHAVCTRSPLSVQCKHKEQQTVAGHTCVRAVTTLWLTLHVGFLLLRAAEWYCHDRCSACPSVCVVFLITLANIIFVTWTLICASYVFFHAELKYKSCCISHRICVTEFCKMQFLRMYLFLALPVCLKYDWGTSLHFTRSVGKKP